MPGKSYPVSAVDESTAGFRSTRGDTPNLRHDAWPNRPVALVASLFPTARLHLATVDEQTTVDQATRCFRSGVEIVLVTGIDGRMTGVLTKTDILANFTRDTGDRSASSVTAADLMTRDVIHCSVTERIASVWEKMHALDLRNVPVTCAERKPVGVVNSRQALIAMLAEAETEDAMLRDYIMGVGYR